MSTPRALPGLLVLLPLLAFPAAADEPEGENPYARPGFYAGFGGGAGIDLFGDDIEDGTVSGADTEHATGSLNARAGYRINSWVAVEAYYEWMESWSTEVGDMRISNLTFHTIVANGKFLWPGWKAFQPYMILGIGATWMSFDDKTFDPIVLNDEIYGSENGVGFAFRPGVGFDLYVTEHLLLNGELGFMLSTRDISTIGVNNLKYFSAGGGIQWRF